MYLLWRCLWKAYKEVMQDTKEQLERNDNGIEQRVHRQQTKAMTHFLAFLKKVFLQFFSLYNFFFNHFLSYVIFKKTSALKF